MNIRKTLPAALALGLMALALSGCIFSPDPDPEPPQPDPVEYDTAFTPLILMDNFQTAYTERDIDGYRELLDDRFKFFFVDAADGFYTKEEDLISTGNMFSGEARTNSEGELTKAISSIDVDQLLVVEPWTDISASDPYYGDIPGVKEALYQIRFVLYHPEGTITVEGQQTFYAVPIEEDGAEIWYLIGQRDI